MIKLKIRKLDLTSFNIFPKINKLDEFLKNLKEGGISYHRRYSRELLNYNGIDDFIYCMVLIEKSNMELKIKNASN